MNTAEILKIKGNIMGTTSIDMKIKGMRKAQDFIVYPLDKNSTNKTIKIQSDTRIGLLNLENGEGRMSKSHQNGAYFHHLQMDNLTAFSLSAIDLQALKMRIFTTADKKAGNSVVKTDNSGAYRVL